MSRIMVLLQGIPGSGKSTMGDLLVKAAQVRADLLEDDNGLAVFVTAPPFVQTFSTDDFWGSNYDYDPAKIGEAHMWNQRRVAEYMARSHTLKRYFSYVIIDNTNITRQNVQPYVALAKMYGYDIQVVRVSCSPAVAKLRQKERPFNRRVPDEVIDRMYLQLEELGEDL